VPFWMLLLVGLAALAVIQFLHFVAVLAWEDQRTVGTEYYGLPPRERARFKRVLKLHARILRPILRLIVRPGTFTFDKGTFREAGVPGPKGTCTPDSFASGMAYQPRPDDVFVVTQMKCGTTWMQHVVFQVLHRGDGDLVETGRTLYGVSPWLEARKSVGVEDAPLLGEERPSRIIKTHLPVSACPFSESARYIYVARHPVSCFASCLDFLNANLGRATPTLSEAEAWFCSDDDMWWGTWASHVAGWWKQSQGHQNVLFVRFEDMKRDLPGVVRQVAEFLGVRPLTEQEINRVVEKCGFAYMQRHSEAFEMHPPHLLATEARLFVKGTASRHRDVPSDARSRISACVADQASTEGFPISSHYPDVQADSPALEGSRTLSPDAE